MNIRFHLEQGNFKAIYPRCVPVSQYNLQTYRQHKISSGVIRCVVGPLVGFTVY